METSKRVHNILVISRQMNGYTKRSAIYSFFDFFVFGNIFIACCAVMMGLFTTLYFTGTWGNPELYIFLFFGTLTSYSFHWYLTDTGTPVTPRSQWLQRYKQIYLILFFVSGCLSFYAFVKLRAFWPALAAGAFFTFLYSAPKIPHPFFQSLKKYAIGKTIFLSLMWTYCTCLLPLLVTGKAIGLSEMLYLANRFSFILAICIIFDVRDKESDYKEGIRSLITRFSPGVTKKYFDISIVFSILSALALLEYKDIVLVILLIIPAIITFAGYKRSIHSVNDYTYYFALDGLMALTPFLYFLYYFLC